MSNIKIVTGNGASVSAEDDRCLNAASISPTNIVFAEVGGKFKAELISNNCVRIHPGEGLLQGVHFRIPSDKYEDMTIDNGTQGMYRYDRIVVRYALNAVTQEEVITMEVIKGKESTTIDEAEYPGWSGVYDKVYDGDLMIDFPLYLVKIEELSITEIMPTFEIMCSLKNIHPVGSIYMSINDTNPREIFGGTWIRWGQGRVPVGVEESDSSFNESEKTGGEKTHKLTSGELPTHSHTIPALTGTAAKNGYHNHSMNYNVLGAAGTAKTIPSSSGESKSSGVINDDGEHSHTVTTNASKTGTVGSGTGHNNMPPYITCYMWLRTA